MASAKHVTDHNIVTLQWRQSTFTKTVKLSKHANVTASRLDHGYTSFQSYQAEGSSNESHGHDPIISQEGNIIKDNELSCYKQIILWKEAWHYQEISTDSTNFQTPAKLYMDIQIFKAKPEKKEEEGEGVSYITPPEISPYIWTCIILALIRYGQGRGNPKTAVTIIDTSILTLLICQDY